MKIKTTLTLQYAIVTAVLLSLFAGTVLYFSEYSRKDSFFRNLRSEAITKAHLFLNSQVAPSVMQSIYTNNKKFINEVEVAVYTPDFKMLYHDAALNDIIHETKFMIDEIKEEKQLNFWIGDYQAVGILYNYKGNDYIVTAAAYDGYGYANRKLLWECMLYLVIFSLLGIIVIGYLLAKKGLDPLRIINSEIEDISASHIDKRLPVKNEKDELGELSSAINSLLDRLEKSFNSQRNFVSNVSHELRTPMAALIAQLDVALIKERSKEEYREDINNALEDAKRVVKLINALLDFAKSDFEQSQIIMTKVRLDELIIDATNLIMNSNSDYHVELFFDEESDDDNLITINGNSYLLTVALVNLMENNCKYSENHTSMVQISFFGEYTILRLSDNGIGMTEIDKINLFKLFYRGENNASSNTKGNGIGMALTQKIIKMHFGEITVMSKRNEGTTFILKFKHI